MGYGVYFCVTTLITCQKFMLYIQDGQLKQHLLIEFTDTAYTGCNRRNGPDFGRVFLMLKYTDITQNTYVQS
jgi:hypothetical protein